MGIHLSLNYLVILLEILDDILLNRPAKEVELAYRRYEGLTTR